VAAEARQPAGRFVLRRRSDGQFQFTLRASNGRTILLSEAYRSRASARNGIASVRRNAVHEDRYVRRTARNGAPYFVLRAGNREIIGTSELYASAAAVENGIASVRRHAPAAPVLDLTTG
jgi:uncharacterized protein YegP (UPF0339 family)